MDRTTQSELLRAREAALQGLLVSGLDGDAQAYRQFLQQLSGHLRSFLRKRLHARPDDLEDLLQEVLLAVHNARHSYQREQPLTAWVQAIARYKLADHLRGQGRRQALNDPLDDSDELFAQEQQEPAQAQRDLGKLLQQLPDKQRLPIVHVKLEGLSVEETAELTGLSGSAVKVGIHRGLKALAALIRGT
ncbi:sigma-70 family RNA polymerase sigma factor [Pseudomonas sp. BBP2017]|uniref:sigma-70 family RNA polymerase sigma factor n=1 Tax=Pseudomonas sp. BBP2017 TaxID=2109731 RepID=UPI000D132FBB|nr:sigma-70 family RNA polymerase sigma factor [Pseudomonas sp. BBP2017]PSS58084.1 RNA polymerase subunit sigma [Pseudomonas sp. BBP2017]